MRLIKLVSVVFHLGMGVRGMLIGTDESKRRAGQNPPGQ